MTDRKPFTATDMAAVSDNPEWMDERSARARSFDEVFPDIALRLRGAQKAPAKAQVTLRLDQRVIDHFKATGDGWQTRVNEALLKVVGLVDR